MNTHTIADFQLPTCHYSTECEFGNGAHNWQEKTSCRCGSKVKNVILLNVYMQQHKNNIHSCHATLRRYIISGDKMYVAGAGYKDLSRMDTINWINIE